MAAVPRSGSRNRGRSVEGLAGILQSLQGHTLWTVASGSAALGIVSGALGCFALLRRQSLLGDAVSHAALPGIALAFLLARSKEPAVLFAGALVAGCAGAMLVMAVVRTTRVKDDAALGLVLSVFFGFGLMLLTAIQKLPEAGQAGLDRFLFGQAATLLRRDVTLMVCSGAVIAGLLGLFWKELKLLAFDAAYGASLGFPMRRLELLLSALLVAAIVLGLQTVGVVLMSAMIVAPAAAARQWTDRLGSMVLIAAAVGAGSGVAGAVASSLADNLPTGPAIVLCASAAVIVSLFLAPRRGVAWRWARNRRNRRALATDVVLGDLAALEEIHGPSGHGHGEEALRAMRPAGGDIAASLEQLEQRGMARRDAAGRWHLTDRGRLRAGAQGRGAEEHP